MADYTGRDQRLKYLFQNGGGGGGSCKVISGYYHNGDFYEDQSYTQIITGSEDSLYIDLDTTTLYLFDGTDYVEVQGGGGGAVSDGTVGVRIDKTFSTNESKTYTYDELGITAKGYYILGIASNHAETYQGWKWYGYLCYSGNTTSGYSYVKAIDYNNISVTMDSVNKTITIGNTNSNWAETFRIEVLPLHPKVEVEQRVISGYYNNGNFYEDSALTILIIGNTKCLYIDLFTTKLYLFDGTNYIVAQGGGGEGGSSFEQFTITEFCDLLSEWIQE